MLMPKRSQTPVPDVSGVSLSPMFTSTSQQQFDGSASHAEFWFSRYHAPWDFTGGVFARFNELRGRCPGKREGRAGLRTERNSEQKNGKLKMEN